MKRIKELWPLTSVWPFSGAWQHGGVLLIVLLTMRLMMVTTVTASGHPAPPASRLGGVAAPVLATWGTHKDLSSFGKPVASVNAGLAGGIEYRLAYNPTTGRYEVYLRPNVTLSAPRQTLTAQVTLKAPHVSGVGAFAVTNLTAATGTSWTADAAVRAPSENPSADYVSVNLQDTTSALNWQAGQEVLAFSFQNSGTCSGAVSVMANSDPFNVAPNSVGTNPGNQIDVLGLGSDPGNDYLGSYGNAVACNTSAGIEYRLAYNPTTGRYEVYLRPTTTASAPHQTLTAQVTLKAPHVSGAGAFAVTNLTAATGTTWMADAAVRAPSENPSADYVSVNLQDATGALNWQAGQEVLAFSFQNSGTCSGAVSVMANSDPFNVAPNSTSTNPGNQIDVLGLGNDPGNDYLGNYGNAAANCAGIEYRLAYNPTTGRYEVYLRPTTTAGAPRQTLTAQVTLKAPHVSGAGAFAITNLTSATGTTWMADAAVRAPSENLSADYVSVNLQDATGALNWQAGQEVLAFSFQNSGTCSGAVSVMANSDPFNVTPNSVGTNPGNQIDVLGLGSDPGNDYLGSYGSAAVCNTSAGIEYRLAYNPTTGRYEVYLRPTTTASAPHQTLTAQVTLKAPHVSGVGAFAVTNLTAATGTSWTADAAVRAPSENPSADYVSVNLQDATGALNWQAGQEILAFSFQNSGTCSGAVSVMANSDPFNVAPNSTSTNPGNQIDVLGLGSDPGNDYLGNYGNAAANCAGIEYRLAYNPTTGRYEVYLRPNATAGAPRQTLTAQVTLKAPHVSGAGAFVITNLIPFTGTTWVPDTAVRAPSENPSADYVSVSLSLPTGVLPWQAGQEVLVFSFQNGMCNSGISVMANSDPFNIAPNSVGTNPGNQIDVMGLGNDPGNDYIGNYGAASVVCPPDLVTTLGQPGGLPVTALMVGVESNLPVTVTDQGVASASGPLTTTVTLPTGVSAPASFMVNGWSCTTSGQLVICINAGPLGIGASSAFYVPMTASAAGGPLTINATTAPVSGETTTGNNAAAPITITVVAFADGCFAATAALNGSQQMPINASTATGSGQVRLDTVANTLVYTVTLSNLTGETMSHIHGFVAPGVGGAIVYTLPMGNLKTGVYTFNESDQASLLQGLAYFNVHTSTYPGGEIRGQIGSFTAVACPSAAKILPIKVLLAGPYVTKTGLMTDALRSNVLIPTTEPYTNLGYSFVGGGGETINASVFNVTGNDAIVDWVVVELRGTGVLSKTVMASRAALLQRDGDVVGLDGVSSLNYNNLPGNTYHVAMRHRNHLGAMTLNPVTLSTSTALVDFTLATTALYGAYAERMMSNGKQALWAGNSNGNKSVVAAGQGNDVTVILADVLGAPDNLDFNANHNVYGYLRTDANMDGKTRGAGPSNDVNIVLTTVLLHPDNVNFAANYKVIEQLP